jgi:hypothetical protein
MLVTEELAVARDNVPYHTSFHLHFFPPKTTLVSCHILPFSVSLIEDETESLTF